MHVLKTNFYGNPNIGLYGYCNNHYLLMGMEVAQHEAKPVADALKVPLHQLTIAGTSLLGVFLAGNSKMLLVPEITFDYELQQLDKWGIKYTVIKSNLTALGNNILCNDTGALVNPEFTPEQCKAIERALGVPVKTGQIAGLDIVGSLAVINKNAAAVHRDVDQKEEQEILEVLGLKSAQSTVNMGSPYIKSGVLCNDHGFAIGDLSSGPEMSNIETELGYIK